jgi:hypothetical protein
MASQWTGWIRVAGEPWSDVVDADTRGEATELLGCVPTDGPAERIVLKAGRNPNEENGMTTQFDRFARSEKLREMVKAMGPDATLEAVSAAAEVAGLGAVYRSAYYSYRRAVFGKSRESKPAKASRKVAAPANGNHHRTPAPGSSAAEAVEIISAVGTLAARLGGRARLREVLDSLDRLAAM